VADEPARRRGSDVFDFAKWHASTGGLNWTLLTPVVELDEAVGRIADTADDVGDTANPPA
jgi:hypothetical protein